MEKDFYEQVDKIAEGLIAEFKSGEIDLARIRAKRRYFFDIVASDGIVELVRSRARIQYWGAKTALQRIATASNGE